MTSPLYWDTSALAEVSSLLEPEPDPEPELEPELLLVAEPLLQAAATRVMALRLAAARALAA
ncbi:MAG TPA: hypothetical protein VN847_20205 [Streptosporangiaceae bacterium]|nr:hypothetical protein [Streptosporangiaceae bacterium]